MGAEESGLCLRGAFSIISLPDLLNLLAISGKSGQLLLTRGAQRAEVLLVEGRIQRIHSPLTIRLLGGLLLREGVVTLEDWGELSCRDSRELLETVLLELPGLDPETIGRLLHELMIEDFSRLLDWSDAGFVFEEGPAASLEGPGRPLPVEALLLHGVHRRDERKSGRIDPDCLLAEARPVLGTLVQPRGERIVGAITLRPGTTTLGCSPQADVQLEPDPPLAPIQVRITLTGRRYFLDDLAPNGSVRLNGRSVERVTLEDGDEIAVGRHRFLFHRLAARIRDAGAP